MDSLILLPSQDILREIVRLREQYVQENSFLGGSGDVYFTLLNYQAHLLANGYSPAELLMARRLRTKLYQLFLQI